MTVNRKDLFAGAFLMLMGGIFVLDASFNLRIGTAVRMGPGFFPVILGGALVAFGIAIAIRSLLVSDQPFGPIPWRAVGLLALAPVLVALTIRGLGLLLSLVLGGFAAAMASKRISPPSALGVAVGLSLFCVLLFGYVLKIPLPIIGTWIGGR